MPQAPPASAKAISPWLATVGSLLIVFHFTAILAKALATNSGPWPTAEGANPGSPPQFAASIDRTTSPNYLNPLGMSHNYHFTSNRPEVYGAMLEARLLDAAGQEVGRVTVPDAKANPWERHRQAMLVQALTMDDPVPPQGGEFVAAPGQAPPTMQIWDLQENRNLQLKTMPAHLVPRDRPVMRPSAWGLLLVRSYGRYLCRTHGAASVEMIRHSREPVVPGLLALTTAPAGVFEELHSNYGKLAP